MEGPVTLSVTPSVGIDHQPLNLRCRWIPMAIRKAAGYRRHVELGMDLWQVDCSCGVELSTRSEDSLIWLYWSHALGWFMPNGQAVPSPR